MKTKAFPNSCGPGIFDHFGSPQTTKPNSEVSEPTTYNGAVGFSCQGLNHWVFPLVATCKDHDHHDPWETGQYSSRDSNLRKEGLRTSRFSIGLPVVSTLGHEIVDGDYCFFSAYFLYRENPTALFYMRGYVHMQSVCSMFSWLESGWHRIFKNLKKYEGTRCQHWRNVHVFSWLTLWPFKETMADLSDQSFIASSIWKGVQICGRGRSGIWADQGGF